MQFHLTIYILLVACCRTQQASRTWQGAGQDSQELSERSKGIQHFHAVSTQARLAWAYEAANFLKCAAFNRLIGAAHTAQSKRSAKQLFGFASTDGCSHPQEFETELKQAAEDTSKKLPEDEPKSR